MIFIFTGSSYKNKNIIKERFLKFLRTDRTNWRRTVFNIDGEDFIDDTDSESYTIDRLYDIVEFIHKNGNDILVALPFDLGEFVSRVENNIDKEDYVIIQFDDEKIKDKDEDIIYVNVTKYSVDNQYSKFIQKIEKIF